MAFTIFTANKFEFTSLKKWLLFAVLLSFMILDRIITLVHFGFVYSDIDQMVMWNGAVDYSKGIFHEPFFYGQPYSYMLESFMAVPLLWMHIPIYIALPVSTSIISLLPFIVLALFFIKRGYWFWAYVCLAFQVLLPLQYNFLATISRGFVQAHLFVPLLFVPLFNPESKRNVTLLFLASALCLIANQSSVLIVLPIALFVYTYHFRSRSFYLKSLLVIPFFIADYFAKYFYIIHPERVLHSFEFKLDGHTFLTSFCNADHFENLFPFFSGWGIVYPFLFILLAIVALASSMKKEFLFILSILILLLITFAIPKVQQIYQNAGIFFTPSRLYMYLPVLLIITLFLVFKKRMHHKFPVYILLLLCTLTFTSKIFEIKETVRDTVSQTMFPVAKNQDLVARAKELKYLAEKYKLDLIVHSISDGWSYIFESYAFNPLTPNYNNKKLRKIISVNINGDRRTWLYPNSIHCNQILLNGFRFDKSILNAFDYKIVNQNQIVIKNNKMDVTKLFERMYLKYGNAPQ